MQTKLCPKCGEVSPDSARKCDCGHSFDSEEAQDEEGQRRNALAQWLGVGRLNVVAFSVTCGLFWGVSLFLITWWIILFDGATGESTLIARVYRGYTISPVGSLVGFGWGLIDGLVGGAIFSWLYNLLLQLSALRRKS
jgi:hypothetical protein